MPRRKREDFKRDVGVDPVYKSSLIQKLTNIVMERGKKNVARKVVYDAIEILAKKKAVGDKAKALAFLDEAFRQIVPVVEVRPRRVGGSVYQVPMEVASSRAQALAMRWLISAASSRPDKTMGVRLAYELIDAHEGRGSAVKKKLDMHRMAEANRAFSHYSW